MALEWIGLFLSVAGAAKNRHQNELNREALREYNLLIIKDAITQYEDISSEELFLDQEIDRASLEVSKVAKQQKGQVELLSNVTGTGGLSMDSLIQDIELERGANIGTLLDNQDQELDNLYREAESIKASADAGIRKVFKPNDTLSIVSAGLEGYRSGLSLENSIARNKGQQELNDKSSRLAKRDYRYNDYIGYYQNLG